MEISHADCEQSGVAKGRPQEKWSKVLRSYGRVASLLCQNGDDSVFMNDPGGLKAIMSNRDKRLRQLAGEKGSEDTDEIERRRLRRRVHTLRESSWNKIERHSKVVRRFYELEQRKQG